MDKIIIFGTGQYTVDFLEFVRLIDENFMNKVLFFVDNYFDEEVYDFNGKEVKHQDSLLNVNENSILIICSNSHEAIVKSLDINIKNKIKIFSYIEYYKEYLEEKILSLVDNLNDKSFKRWIQEVQSKLKKDIFNETAFSSDISNVLDYYINGYLMKVLNGLYALKKQPYTPIYSDEIAINGRLPYYASEIMLTYLLANNGVKVHHFYENFRIQQYIDNLKQKNSEKNHLYIAIQLVKTEFYKYFFRHPNIKFYHSSDLLNLSTTIDNESVRKHARSNTKREVKTDLLNFDDESTMSMYKLQLEIASVSWCIGEYIKQEIDPDLFITSHAIYSPHGPCFDFLRNSGYECIVYDDSSHVPHCYTIENNVCNILANRGESIKQSMKLPLTVDKINRVDEYMTSRLNLKAHDNSKYYKNEIGFDSEKYIQELKNFKGSSKLFIAFPNIIWDGAEEERNTAFDSIVNWMLETIEFFENNDYGKLAIRFHPAEKYISWYSKEKKFYDVLVKMNPNIPFYKNVFFIHSDVPLNSYLLSDELMDIAIMYSGTVGFEFPYMNKNVISAGNGRCSYYGVNYVVEDKKDYFSIIEKINKDEVCILTFKESIYKFIHWYLFDLNYYFPIIDGVYGVPISYEYDFNLENNIKLKKTIERLLNKIK